MSTHDRGPSLKEIKTILRKTRKTIEEEKKLQRWNDLQTRHIVSQIANKISPEGVDMTRPNLRSNSQIPGAIRGQTGPTNKIFNIMSEHLSQQRDSLESKDHHDNVYRSEREKHMEKKEHRRVGRISQKNKMHTEKPKACKTTGCTISGGEKKTRRTKKRIKETRKRRKSRLRTRKRRFKY